jgi:hypothetical protein
VGLLDLDALALVEPLTNREHGLLAPLATVQAESH